MGMLADMKAFAEEQLAAYEAMGELSPLHFVGVDMAADPLVFMDRCFEVVGVRHSFARAPDSALPAVCLIVLAEDYDALEVSELQHIPDEVSTRYVVHAKGKELDLVDVER